MIAEIIKMDEMVPAINSVTLQPVEQVMMDIPCIISIPVQTMNLPLLKKVEELTLYLIDERKENQQQQEEIAELRAVVETLKASER